MRPIIVTLVLGFFCSTGCERKATSASGAPANPAAAPDTAVPVPPTAAPASPPTAPLEGEPPRAEVLAVAAYTPHLMISRTDTSAGWEKQALGIANQLDGVVARRILVTEAFIEADGKEGGGLLLGIDGANLKGAEPPAPQMVSGSVDDLWRHRDSLLIGTGLAQDLGLEIGETASLRAVNGGLAPMPVG